ncbi:hypothetical protein JW960_13890, partial [candidate division KSB1 bacterium]|nr:hypothetical protein [candidate division KSB1 bacterium]
MKKLVIISFLMLLFSGSTTIVHATLSVGSFSGIEYVYDNVSNLTWHRDLGVYVNMDYDTQVAGINALSTLP